MEATSKNFKKRNAILSYLQHTTAHPSAETIFSDLKAEIPDLSMGTVYRNLKLFQQQGLVSCIATVHGVERFDANTDPHVHFVCSDCSEVIDLHQIAVPQELSNTVEEISGCHPDGCQLSFTGLCGSCYEKNQKIS